MLAFLLSFLLSAAITPAVIRWYKKNNWIEQPQNARHVKTTHTESVPRGGGIPIFLSALLCAYLLLTIDVYLIAILIGAALLTIVGIYDDIYNVNPAIRIGTGLLAALIVVGSGIGIAYVSNPFAPGVIHLDQPRLQFFLLGSVREIWVLSDLFALVFIIWNMNSVNWSKGVDGQLPGFVAAALVFIGLLSTRFIDDPTNFNTQQMAFILAGSFAGYLIWNWYPQKTMPGYGAGSLAGYFLAVLSILSGAKLATLLMVLAIPTTDAVFSIGRRIAAGKSPLWGDRGHLHHKLLDVLGWSKQKIALFYTGTSIGMGVLSLYLTSIQKVLAVAIVGILVVSFLVWAKYMTLKKTV